jgi:O-antigen biosynthesis protein
VEARLKSIARQAYPVYEIIYLDDCSSDKSLETAQKFGILNELDMKVYSSDTNSGSAFKQWAKGISMAKGDYIWIAEADDLCDTTFLEEAMKGFEDEEVVLSYCQSKQIDENGNILSENYLNYTDDIDGSKWLKNYIRDGRLEIADSLVVKNTIPNVSAVVFKKTQVDAIVDRLTSFKIAGDWFFYIWMLQNGKISYCAKPLNLHRRHTCSVVASENAKLHYDEVIQLQDHILRNFPVDTQIRNKVYSYRDHVRKYLGMPDQ